MRKETLSSGVLIIGIKPLVLICLFFLILFWFLPISQMNPLPLEPVHSGQLTPLHETPVYLKSEDISANISEVVRERTVYVLQNSGNVSINLSIALPFSSGYFGYHLPANISLTINGSVGSYVWSTFNYTNSYGYNLTCFAIIFNLTFTPREEKIIVANYSRHFSFTTGWRAYNYITETAMFWNRSIEHARFNYRLDTRVGTISIHGLDNYSSHQDGTDLVINKEFHDWMPTSNIGISFDLGGPPNYFFKLWDILITSLSLLTVVTIIYLTVRKKRNKKKK